MKRIIFTITLLSFIFWFTGCNESLLTSPEDDISLELLSKAGNDNPNTEPVFANYFDLSGNLCSLNYGEQLLGDPLELWMGVGNQDAGTKVGEITFNGDCVLIDLSKGEGVYDATAIHMDFANTYEEFHTNKPGNPIVGKFDYNYDTPQKLNSIRISPSVYMICGIDLSGFSLGAIHVDAVPGTGISSVEDFEKLLPKDLVTMSVENYTDHDPIYFNPSYFKLKIGEDGGILTGECQAWCIDTDRSIMRLYDYPAYIYSSYDDSLPDWLIKGENNIENPQNLDVVNYLLNNYAAGDEISLNCNIDGPVEILTSGDIQRAIWSLMDDDNLTNDVLGPWEQTRVDAIICDVEANGEGFEPGCGEYIVFIVVPIRPNGEFAQPVICKFPILCPGEGSGTAWADGKYGIGFTGNSWATYFAIGCDE